MILVTTTGKVGFEATHLLGERGVTVRDVMRRPENVSVLADTGAEVVSADLAVPAGVDEALRGASTVVFVSPALPELELNVIDRARRATVSHVVKITSKASADSPIARRRAQAGIERALIGSGLGSTLLRNNAYMQNFLMLAQQLAQTNIFASPTGGSRRIGMIDTRNLAAVAASIARSGRSRRHDVLADGPRSAELRHRGGDRPALCDGPVAAGTVPLPRSERPCWQQDCQLLSWMTTPELCAVRRRRFLLRHR